MMYMTKTTAAIPFSQKNTAAVCYVLALERVPILTVLTV